ncbi:GDP-mannose-dependent alpha-(1-6)-phosphatidylinositol monomannoside mannosyltransferase [bacterium BMS3Abin15]|nr:GDP-mannose-dependent alpha-(1-6)-phosphatidylinositol monomannoside mannosyltransferase [bacterium BMS3Abin15]
MKILVFSPYYPPHIGGLETHADEFNKYLSQKGVDITVFTPQLPTDSLENEIKHSKVKITRFSAFEIIPGYPLPKFWQIKFWKLFHSLFKEEFDIVISRTRFFNTSLLALFFAKTKHIKWVHIEHGSDFVKSGGVVASFIAKAYDYTFGKLVLKLSDKNVANSIASSEFCKKLSGGRDCEVVYRGVEIEKIKNISPALDIRNKYGNKIIVTFIGRLIDGKGVADLLEVLGKTDNENIICILIGDGPQMENLKGLAKKIKIEDEVIFMGYKKIEEAIGILKISDIFVNPSYTEGLPSSVVEAALCKKAIIATNVGGTPEIITGVEDGYLVNPKDIGTLSQHLVNLIKNPEKRKQFGENAQQKVKIKFSWDKSIEKYLKIFDEQVQK